MSNPHGHEPKVSSAQATGSQRGIKSTRTPATRVTKDAEPQHAHRSQTIPTPAPPSSTRRMPTPQSSMPVPSANTSSRQRTPSFPKSQTNPSPSPRPELPQPKTSLDGTGYIVEPLQPSFRSESREGRREPPVHLVPPSSMPIPKAMSDSTRQSVSSFQTEPSSYYSAAEDGGSPVGTPIPPPQMPEPSHTEHETQANRYESLWLAAQAAQAPPMPTPEIAHPPISSVDLSSEPYLSSPYDDRDNEGGSEEEYEEDVGESGTDGFEEHVDTGGQQDRYDSSWLAGPSPGMPIATPGHSSSTSAPDPPMPVPNTGSYLGTRPGHGTARVNQTSQGPGAGPRPVGIAPPTAPLKIHHAPRPTGLGPPSPGLPPSAGPASTNQAPNQNQPTPGRVNFQQQQNVGSGFSTASRPQNERPPITTPSNTLPPSSSTHKIGSSYETRPPGASAPSIPSAVNASASAAQHNAPGKQYTSQNSVARPGRTQVTITSTHSPTSSLPSAQPAAATNASPSSPSTAPSKHTQSSSVGNSYAKPAVSSNLAPQKTNANVSNNQTQHSTATITARPQAQVLETTRPSISAPQVQHQASTGSSTASKQQARIHEASAAVAAGPTRPRFNATASQMDTQYVNMLLALDDIPALYNLLAGFFNWILLAGFILFPGTFTSLQNLNATSGVTAQVQHQVVNAITHVPLFIVAWVCTGVGAVGMAWLSWRWRKNYLWGLNKIFMPGFLNSLAGLLSTIANIFGVQHGELVTTSKVTLIVTAASTGVLAIITAFYSLWLVRRVKARHDRQVGKERAGKYGEGVVDLSKRKVNGSG